MNNKIKIGSPLGSSGLGDILLLTSICKHTDCIVDLPPKAERFSCLFDGIAEVNITETPTRTPDIGPGNIH